MLFTASMLLSSSSVQTRLAKIITAKVNEKYGTTILVEKVDLSTLRNITLKNVLIKDHHLDTLIYANTLSTSILSYRNILESNLNFGVITLKNGGLLMKTYEGEDTNNLTVFSRKFDSDNENSTTVFEMKSSSIFLENVDFVLSDENKSTTPIVFYNNITGYFDNFKIYGTEVSADIHDLSAIENFGVNIEKFKTQFLYTETKMKFLETELSTEYSSIFGDIVFNYAEGDLSDFSNKVHILAEISQADIGLYDLKKFYNEFGKNDKIHFKALLKGTLNDFVLKDIDLNSDRNSVLVGTIHIENVTNPENFKLQGDLLELSSSYDHLKNLLPNLLGKNIPTSFEKFGQFNSYGKIQVTKTSVNAKLNVFTEMGIAKTDIQLSNIDNIDNAFYKGKLELIDFNLEKYAKDSLLGKLSMVAEIDGRGFKMDNVNSRIKGHISKHQYKGYTYSNIDINGNFKDKHFNGELQVNDPNIQLIFKGLADLSQKEYVFDFNADIAYADFNTLNLFKRDSTSILKGKVAINLVGTNLDDLVGELNFKDASYTNQKDNYYFKDFAITSVKNDSLRVLTINSPDIISGSVKGNFKFKELDKIAKNSLGSLFINFKKVQVSEGQFLEFNFNIYNKIVDVFFPEVKISANSLIRGEINSDNDVFQLTIKSPEFEAYQNKVENIRLQVDNKNPLYNTLLSVDKINTKYYNIEDLNLVNVTLNDTLFIRTDFVGGKDLKEKYNFSFYHTVNENNLSVFGIKKSEMEIKNNIWQINPHNNNQNKVVFDKSYKNFAIDKINFVSGFQFIDLAGVVNGKESRNIDLTFENVNLNDITPPIDSLNINGKINGSLHLKTVDKKTLPFADLRINYFNINNDYYGDLVFNAVGDEEIMNYAFKASLLNSDLQTFTTEGNLDLNPDIPVIIANVKFDQFKINSFSPLGKNVLSKIRGFASGNASITGAINNPNIDGNITLKKSGIELPYLNVNYNFIGESRVKLYQQTFEFLPIAVQDDVMKTTGTMMGKISHKEFKKWDLNLRLFTDNLLVLNTKDSEDAVYYGTGLLAGLVTLKGPTDNLVININGITNAGTEFILPLSYISTVGESRLIHFENPSKTIGDEESNEKMFFDQLKGLSINLNLEVTKDAVAEVVIDRITGSLLRGRGDGDIALNIDTNGKFEMYGALVVDSGEYQFKNIVNKNFEMKKGGTIIWNGSPYDAELSIEAVNRTKANPAVLLDEINSSRKIDVNLITTITGALSAPNFDFDIEIPNASTLVTSELDFKLNNPDDKLTQFFSVLATGSFINLDQSNTDFNGNAAISGTISEKASKVLTEMLKSSNDEFQVGVTYDKGSTNSVEDVITDDQLGILVSGKIADKVTVSGKVGVPVGSNTSSSVIGEVEVMVPLNKAETFQAKAYNRQNEIQFDVIDGEGYTQGVGISYRFEFDNSKEFFEKIGLKKTEEEKAEIKRKKDSIKVERRMLSKKN